MADSGTSFEITTIIVNNAIPSHSESLILNLDATLVNIVRTENYLRFYAISWD